MSREIYGHLFPGQDAEAVASLPDILGRDITSPDAQRATGNDGQSAGLVRGNYRRKSPQDIAASCEPDAECENENDTPDASPNVLPCQDLSDNRREPADCLASSRSGTRTRTSLTGQRILSPLRLPFRHPALVLLCWD